MPANLSYIPMAEPLPLSAGDQGKPAMGPPPITYPENFSALPTDAKYAFFKNSILETAGKPFASLEVAQSYRRRWQRWFDIIELKEPDRVPNLLMAGGYIAKHTGIREADTFYDPLKTAEATIRFYDDFQSDYAPHVPSMPGRMFDRLGISIMRWPGGPRSDALGVDTPFQYVEGEYVKGDEYEQLIRNPEGYLLRTWFPRAYEKLKGLSALPTFFAGVEPSSAPMLFLPLAMGPVREAIDTLLAAADSCLAEMLPGFIATAEIQRRWGAPNVIGSFSLAPFDIIGDTLRGTRAVLTDMYRKKDALIAACDAVVPMAIKLAVDGAMASGTPFVVMPLHKGDDTFMSEAQFARFYWPSFKRVLEGIIAAGLIPVLFVEGIYNNKLDVIAGSDLQKGKTLWMFDRTDMKIAKEKLGGKACIGGNVPASIFAAGTAEQMDAYCKNVIEAAAPGGGFLLSCGAIVDHASPETVHAFVQSTKKYGVY